MLTLALDFSWLNTGLHMFLLWIDSIVYFFVSSVYKLFIYLSTSRIFEDAFFANFANRIYAILGVFMLFYLAYALLNAIIDPEKLAKGDKSVSKLAQNLIISLVMLGFLPSVFTYAYRLQNYVLSSNLIGALVMGTKMVDPTESNEIDGNLIGFGDSLSFTVMNAFINPTNENVNMGTNYNWYDLKSEILAKGDYGSLPGLADAVVKGAPVAGSGSAENKKVQYYAVISTAVGIYLIYILLSFTLDLGVRIIKLAFCQLIAPIPIIMRSMPSKKGTFDKWLKLTLSVYFEIFLRVGIMYISVYFVKELADNQIITKFIGDGIMGMFALVVVILGIFTFAKQAPKMISETLGIDTANMKLGIGEKLKGSGFLGKSIHSTSQRVLGTSQRVLGAATGSIGAGITGLANGAGAAGFLFGAANGWKNKGMQFGKQRGEIYSKLTGDYKGKPGMFGGASISNKVSKYMTDLPVAQASLRRQKQMKKFEDKLLADRKEAFENQKNSELKDLKRSYDEKKVLFEKKNKEELKNLEEKYATEKEMFESNKQEKLKNLNNEFMRAKTSNNISEMGRIEKELKSVESSTYSNDSLLKSIANIKGKQFSATEESKNIQQEMQKISNTPFDENIERQAIHDAYNKDLDKMDHKYKERRENKEKLLTDRASKKYHANVVNADRLGEASDKKKTEELLTKALKDLGFENKDKK